MTQHDRRPTGTHDEFSDEEREPHDEGPRSGHGPQPGPVWPGSKGAEPDQAGAATAGAAVGAVAGGVAGPPGMAAGAIVGAVGGAALGTSDEVEEAEEASGMAEDAETDEPERRSAS